jgi:hypothetical protein
MPSPTRSRWRRRALVGYLALDLLALIALLVNQAVSENPLYPWLIALGLVLIALPTLGRAADYLLMPPPQAAIVPDTGEKIP